MEHEVLGSNSLPNQRIFILCQPEKVAKIQVYGIVTTFISWKNKVSNGEQFHYKILGKHCRRKKQNSAHEASTSFLR
jgi:hypothetical protein